MKESEGCWGRSSLNDMPRSTLNSYSSNLSRGDDSGKVTLGRLVNENVLESRTNLQSVWVYYAGWHTA